MGKFVDLTGKKYGKLLVIKRIGTGSHGQALWECQCECGSKTTVRGDSLRNGHTQSCGCIQKEISGVRMVDLHLTHGMTNTRLYRIWCGVKRRCNNPNDKPFHNYGGRGITVCKEWNDSFEAFCDWALNNGYQETLTIDRINNNGNYCPENCRWATCQEQNNNRRDNYIVSIDGATDTLVNMCRKYGANYNTVSTRIFRDGWNAVNAILF